MKNIVIIGAGAGGVSVAKDLAKSKHFPKPTHRIILIERNEFAYWPIGSLRASVLPGFEEKVIDNLQNVFDRNSKHFVLSGFKVIKLESDHVQLNEPTKEFKDAIIPFDQAILATGSIYSFPARPKSQSIDEAKKDLKILQKAIRSARLILLVGGGPVGIELAGEIKAVYPEKQIVIVNSSNWLIATLNNENVHKKLSREIERAGNISLILQDKVHIPENIPTATLHKEEILLETQKGRSISTDLIFNAIGTKPSSELVAKADGEAINDQGFVRIKGDLRIRSNKVAKYIAIGDVNDNPFRKTVMNTFSQVPVAVATVLKSISPQSGIQDKQFGPPMSGMLIPFGPKGGIAKFPFGVFGGWAASMQR